MKLSHSEESPFEKPEVGERYSSHDHGWVAVTEFRANRVEKYRDEPDSAYFGIGIMGVGMGGASLVRRRVVPWDEYSNLDYELKEAAISSTECVVEPPGKWKLAIKSALAGYIWPSEHSAGTLMFQYPNELWDIEGYHDLTEDARIVADIPDSRLEKLHETVNFYQPEAGEIYLNSHGAACIFSKISNNSSLGCTRYKLSEVKPVVVDLEDTYVLPVSEQERFTGEKLGDFGWDYENVWVQPFGTMGFHRRAQIIFDTIIDPDSFTARLGRRQEWMNFGLSTDKESLISKIGSGTLNVDDEVTERLEDVELEKRRKLNDKVDDYKNSVVDSVREFTRKRNL